MISLAGLADHLELHCFYPKGVLLWGKNKQKTNRQQTPQHPGSQNAGFRKIRVNVAMATSIHYMQSMFFLLFRQMCPRHLSNLCSQGTLKSCLSAGEKDRSNKQMICIPSRKSWINRLHRQFSSMVGYFNELAKVHSAQTSAVNNIMLVQQVQSSQLCFKTITQHAFLKSHFCPAELHEWINTLKRKLIS